MPALNRHQKRWGPPREGASRGVAGRLSQQSTVSRLHSTVPVDRPPFIWMRRTATIQNVNPQAMSHQHRPSSPKQRNHGARRTLEVSGRVTLVKNKGSGTVNFIRPMNQCHLPFAASDNMRRGSAVDGAPSYRRHPPKCGTIYGLIMGRGRRRNGSRALLFDLTASDSASGESNHGTMYVHSNQSTLSQALRVPLRCTETSKCSQRTGRDFTSE